MAIYTRTGDAGTTSLFTGQRVSKTHPRVEAYGTLDELNAALSLCACAAADENHRTLLEAIQQQLFGLAQSWPATASSRRPNSATSAAKRFRPRKPLSIGQWPASNRCTALFYPDAAKPRADYILPARWRAAPNAVWLNWQLKSTYAGADALHQPLIGLPVRLRPRGR